MPIRKLKVTKFSEEAVAVYEKFAALANSEHIAKPITLEAILQICHEHNTQRILELGGGLGTISYLMLKNSQAILDIYEHDPRFQEALRQNLSQFEGRFRIIADYRMLPPERHYDLVVVDGGQTRKDQPDKPDAGFNEAIWLYLLYLQSVRFVYIEGNRHIQRLWARKALRRRYKYNLIRFADFEYEKELLPGGLLIECKRSNSRLGRLINFLFWEIVEWNSVRNFVLFNLKKLR